MRVVTQNVCQLPAMPQKFVREDVRRTAHDADVIVWQEIRPLRYKLAIRRLPKGTWRHAMSPFDGGAPISWRTRKYELIEKGNIVLHPRTRGICERRAVTWVLLRDRATGCLFVVVNAHYVPKAFLARVLMAERAQRLAMWEAGNAAHVELLAGFIAKGYAVVGGGDFNRLSPYPVVGSAIAGRKVRYGTQLGCVDRLYWMNGDHAVWTAAISDTLRDRHSDHAGRRVTMQLHRRKAGN